MARHFETVDHYIASHPADVQSIRQEVRCCCHAAVPGSGEKISHGIPTITLGGASVVHFAGWAHHVSMHPGPDGEPRFRAPIAPYRASKGTLSFPLTGRFDGSLPTRRVPASNLHGTVETAMEAAVAVQTVRDAGPGHAVFSAAECSEGCSVPCSRLRRRPGSGPPWTWRWRTRGSGRP
ncbi:uncharacterized protein YdhG (YjbR/CyaY superfamily) [Arthrobacter sp. MP_M7]|nr:uncharacterized protein YdhG (YjbR/CyaY superfamily) [Arthrobacter sp. MP_M4]MEC5203598.1 uncharacterized protein YdhG (YjbR/CyaY superfamily) [Arthrobacter sp. MP_M7]